MGFLSYATFFLEYFAIETDALLSYDSVHYQDYSVNRAPIHRAFRAQTGVSAYGRQLMASADVNEPVETDSRLHSQDVRLVAGHVSATLDEGTDDDVGGHMSFLLSSGTGQLSFGHEDEGADIQQHISAATGDPDGLHRSDMRSAVLVTYPPSHGIRAHPQLRHLWLCLAPRRCYSEGLPLTCGTGGM